MEASVLSLPRAPSPAPRFTIRALHRGDHEALRALHATCPVQGSHAVHLERGDDFFAWPSHVFERYRYAGLLQGGRLVASLLGGVTRAWTGARYSDVLYLGDARVLPEARGLGAVGALLAFLIDELAAEIDLASCTRRRDNGAAGAMLDQLATVPGFSTRVAPIHVVRVPGSPSSLEVRRANAHDEPVVTELVKPLFALDATALLWERRSALEGPVQWWVADDGAGICGVVAVDAMGRSATSGGGRCLQVRGASARGGPLALRGCSPRRATVWASRCAWPCPPRRRRRRRRGPFSPRRRG